VELVDGRPPEPFVVDLQTGERLLGEALEVAVETGSDRWVPASAEGDPACALTDGEVFVEGGRALRAWIPQVPDATRSARMHLRDGIDLDIDVDGRVATFSQGGAEVVVRGEVTPRRPPLPSATLPGDVVGGGNDDLRQATRVGEARDRRVLAAVRCPANALCSREWHRAEQPGEVDRALHPRTHGPPVLRDGRGRR
jgi:hypothetical protein